MTLPLPQSLKTTPRLERWVRFNADRTVTVFSGKVELGQGIETAIAQIAAHELDVPLERLSLVAGDTTESPDEWYTAGSQSIEVGGMAMRLACAEVRRLFLEAAARELEVNIAELTVRDGTIEVAGTDLRTSYWDLAAHVDLARDASGAAAPKAPWQHGIVGKSAPRRDLRAKVTGAAFVHDLELPGMVFGRVLRPPSYSARLTAFDADAVRALPGVVVVVVSGEFIGICAEREEQVASALDAARRTASWEEESRLPSSTEVPEFLPALPSVCSLVHRQSETSMAPGVRRLEATYSKPYIAHASIGPSCALALFDRGKFTVWSHTQGSHHLRAQLAQVLGVASSDVEVIHKDGAGCYGHNGADDVALDAALLARACARPVLVQWTREDELAWSPYGSAMVVRVAASLDAKDRIIDWQHEIWSHTHIKRPGWAEGVNLLAAWHLNPPVPVPPAKDVPQPAGGADRNSIPLYDFPAQEIAYNFIADMPLRVSALRSLGAFANVFAIESFMDELAAAIDSDPIEFRLRHLKDARAREVIEAAANAVRWTTRERGNGTRGRGLGFARYKNRSAYCAVIAEVEVGETLRVKRVVAAVDAGEVINPDGLANQIEGGIVQAVSWTLKEQVLWDRSRVLSRSWETYPILRFDETPEIEVLIMPRAADPPLGSGECAAGPTAAAVANALFNAVGVRARHLPLTPDRIARAME
ncbi:MAG TPA: molybdopterin cofactor-binding domain-containing protein [Casimicrobiaceae bacterium]|nr:molybdopterin cofactor-binding domain-containing protein [Casimicrobiaceae bacterium]